MVLRVRVRVERRDGKLSAVYSGVVGTGFSGRRPEILIPHGFIDALRLEEVSRPVPASKISGGGTAIPLVRYEGAVRVYVDAGDRVEGPVASDVLVSEAARYVLLNDRLVQGLKIVVIDPVEGLWCFRDELGRKVRKGL